MDVKSTYKVIEFYKEAQQKVKTMSNEELLLAAAIGEAFREAVLQGYPTETLKTVIEVSNE